MWYFSLVLQSIKRQPQQQRTDQQQYPREIPPRFQKMKKQHMQQQSQSTQFQSNPQTLQQQNRVQVKPQPTGNEIIIIPTMVIIKNKNKKK
jgi:uncharacterized protein (DUF1786 family)